MIEPCGKDTEIDDGGVAYVAVDVIYLPAFGDTANPRTCNYHVDSDGRVTAPYKRVLRVPIGLAHDRRAAARMLLGPRAIGVFTEDQSGVKTCPELGDGIVRNECAIR